MKWYRLAAGQGRASAQYNLGYNYMCGRGVGKNKAEALKWYHLAADQGYEEAKKTLSTYEHAASGSPSSRSSAN